MTSPTSATGRAGSPQLREARALGREIGDPDLLAQTAIGLSDVLRHDGRSRRRWPSGSRAPRRPTGPACGAAQGAFSALNAAEAAFELGRWDVVPIRVVGDILAERATDTAFSAALDQQGVLASARGDLEGGQEALRARG